MDMSQPYIVEEVIRHIRHYNPNYGDHRICDCGHTYYRHFDSYEDMRDVGCKYCACDTFEEDPESNNCVLPTNPIAMRTRVFGNPSLDKGNKDGD